MAPGTLACNDMKLMRKVLGRSLAPLTHSLAPHCSLARSRAHGRAIYVYEMNSSISYTINPRCAHAADKNEKKSRLLRNTHRLKGAVSSLTFLPRENVSALSSL